MHCYWCFHLVKSNNCLTPLTASSLSALFNSTVAELIMFKVLFSLRFKLIEVPIYCVYSLASLVYILVGILLIFFLYSIKLYNWLPLSNNYKLYTSHIIIYNRFSSTHNKFCKLTFLEFISIKLAIMAINNSNKIDSTACFENWLLSIAGSFISDQFLLSPYRLER